MNQIIVNAIFIFSSFILTFSCILLIVYYYNRTKIYSREEINFEHIKNLFIIGIALGVLYTFFEVFNFGDKFKYYRSGTLGVSLAVAVIRDFFIPALRCRKQQKTWSLRIRPS